MKHVKDLQLFAYSNEELSEKESASVAHHVHECTLCQTVLDSITLSKKQYLSVATSRNSEAFTQSVMNRLKTVPLAPPDRWWEYWHQLWIPSISMTAALLLMTQVDITPLSGANDFPDEVNVLLDYQDDGIDE